MLGRSLYEDTKSSIQKGIMDLQQKIRRRKQLQLQRYVDDRIIGSDKLYQYQLQLGQLHKVYDEAKHIPLVSGLSYLHSVEPLLIDYPPYDPLALTIQQIKQKIKRQTFHLQYLKRLEKIKQQNQTIQEKFSSLNKSVDSKSKAIRKNININQKDHLREQLYGKYSKVEGSQYDHLPSEVKRYPVQLDKSSEVNKFNINQRQVNSYQYDQIQEQDSSMLVDKYNKGLKAEQYFKDIRKLDQLEQKLRAIQSGNQVIFTKKYNVDDRQQNTQGYQQTKKQFERSPKISPEKIVQKSPIPIIKEDIEQGVQTVINSAHRNKKDVKDIQDNQTNFLNDKLQKVINSQKGQSQRKSSHREDRPSNSQRKVSNRSKFSQNKFMNTIDVSTLNKSDNSPIRRINDKVQRKYNNPYLVNRKSSNKFTRQNKSAIVSQRNRSHSQTAKNKQVYQHSIPFLLYPDTQKVEISQNPSDLIRLSCNQKIKRRLVQSKKIFKDSKLRNTKHEIDHLWNKFQNQIKARKQIKDKINTNPKILKKHKMVVQ